VRRIQFSEPALRDLADILDRSVAQFGDSARERYEILIETALQDLAADPERRGSREAPGEIGRGRLYHLKWSRRRSLARGGGVRSPSHLIAYRELAGGVLFVQRILHEVMDLPNVLGHAKPDE
jgi:toxin ParE1/3/4